MTEHRGATAAELSGLQTLSVRICSANVGVLRLDKIDDIGSGNKYFKLKYNLQQARNDGYQRLISFGGAYSNHIHALALAGAKQGFETVGLIRGERTEPLNDTLKDAVDAGMQLHYLTRTDYRRRHDPDFIDQLSQQFPGCYWIPEGGSNLLGVRGCMDIADYIDDTTQLIILPCATAVSLAGVAAACPRQKVLGISVLKNAFDLEYRVSAYLKELVDAGFLQKQPENWSIQHGYHCGGYARVNIALSEFMQQFERDTDIPIEPVYSGKMFYAIHELLADGTIDGATHIVAIHTGGMQGLRGLRTTLSAMYSRGHSRD